MSACLSVRLMKWAENQKALELRRKPLPNVYEAVKLN